LSLIIVYKYLLSAKTKLLSSLIKAFLIGNITICVTFIVWFISAGLKLPTSFSGLQLEVKLDLVFAKLLFLLILKQPSQYFWSVGPAYLVHLWLLLFAIGALATRLLFIFFQSVEYAQWFLKQGNQHPLRAIGLPAALFVFIGTVVWRVVTVI
jgi:hypothetical protein